jgi:1-pyrroline-5-carboxylate dehydrogenase
VSPDARISQEEIFGPVLAVIKAKDWTDALNIANNTEFGLTGAVYSRNRRNIEQARKEFHVGNLYLNRKCTGALVGVHPFGGFNMSGTDSKAGGKDYLLLFTQAKAVSERF